MNTTFSFLHQIFYQHNKFDDPADIQCLEKWMLIDHYPRIITQPLSKCLDTNTTNRASKVDEHVVVTPQITPTNQSPVSTIFTPVKEDTLFWSAYTVHHGEAGYHVIGNRYKNTEIQEKQKMLDFMRAHTGTFKQSSTSLGEAAANQKMKGISLKITNVCIQEVQSELMINKKTSWTTFWMMCVYYKFHAIVLHNKTYRVFNPTILSSNAEPIQTFLFTCNRDGHVSVDLQELSREKIEEIARNRICLQTINPDEPLRSITNYKVAELEEMINIVGIDRSLLPAKPKKQDLYIAVYNSCKW